MLYFFFYKYFSILVVVTLIISIAYELSSPKARGYFPSPIAMAVGMYVAPNWTMSRVFGTLISLMWVKMNPKSHQSYAIVTASGLVLGEGVFAIITAIFKSFKVPILTCAGCIQNFCDGCQ